MDSGNKIKDNDGLMLIESEMQKSYSLDQLLAECNGNAEVVPDDVEWLNNKPINRELI